MYMQLLFVHLYANHACIFFNFNFNEQFHYNPLAKTYYIAVCYNQNTGTLGVRSSGPACIQPTSRDFFVRVNFGLYTRSRGITSQAGNYINAAQVHQSKGDGGYTPHTQPWPSLSADCISLGPQLQLRHRSYVHVRVAGVIVHELHKKSARSAHTHSTATKTTGSEVTHVPPTSCHWQEHLERTGRHHSS